ncbi:MAG: hypothetical protein LBC97_13020 [Bifidobacteriaceae bacterium]|jgi:hypothetical protein|nr:hypothetical protein [Bifidobacteriaceae bacterium]
MTEAGVAADVAPMEGDQRLVADFVSESVATVVWKTPDGYGGYTKGLLATPELEQQAEAALDELSKDRRQEYKLIVDGVDMSKEFEQCYESSGYTDPSRIADPRRELADKEAIVEASLRWAECARANGFPSTKDPIDPVADDYATRPTLTLPKDITAEELNKLLTSCPVWDESGPSDQAAPSIGFDVPGFDGNRGIDKLSRDEAAWYGQLLAQIQESAEATRPAGW